MNLAIVVCTVLGFIFAFIMERADQKNSYILSKPRKGDSLKRILRKIERCSEYDRKTVKWRRSYMGAVILIILLYVFLYQRKPRNREYLITLSTAFLVFYFNWEHFSIVTSGEAAKYNKENIENLKEILKGL